MNGLEINLARVIITFNHKFLVFNVGCGPRLILMPSASCRALINIDLRPQPSLNTLGPVIESYIITPWMRSELTNFFLQDAPKSCHCIYLFCQIVECLHTAYNTYSLFIILKTSQLPWMQCYVTSTVPKFIINSYQIKLNYKQTQFSCYFQVFASKNENKTDKTLSCEHWIQDLVYLSHIMRKPIFGICNQVRLKLACSATETS